MSNAVESTEKTMDISESQKSEKKTDIHTQRQHVIKQNQCAETSEEIQDELSLPVILDGKFFHVKARDEKGNISAECVQCKKLIKGSLIATTNFKNHLKVFYYKSMLYFSPNLQFKYYHFNNYTQQKLD